MSRAHSHLCLLVTGAALLGGFGGAAAPLLAQVRPVAAVSQPVVQSIPGGEGMKLDDALGRLAKDPRDVAALLDAGKASLDLGDVDAAIGFFQRASTLNPGNARAKAGLAGAYVLRGDPFTAIPLFKEAEQAGPIDSARLADRGLAYDLVGDNQTAQRYYRQSLAEAPSDDTLRRLAISQAIAGDRRDMELTLAPLLQRQEKAAWRTRAFALAILGYSDEAESIARQSLPVDRAAAMSAYLRYMPRLTPAQQARAGILGHFPRAAEIGSDDPRVGQYARPRTVLAAAPAPVASAPKGKPKGRDRADRNRLHEGTGHASQVALAQSAPQANAPVQAAVAPPEPHVGRETVGQSPVYAPQSELPPVASSPNSAHLAAQAPVLPPAPPAPAPSPSAPPPVRTPVSDEAAKPAADPGPAPEPARATASPGFDLRQVPPPPSHARQPVAMPPRQASLEEVFADFSPPSREAEPEAGAVDVRKIQSPPATKEAAAKELQLREVPAKEAKGARDAKGKPIKGKAGSEAAGKDALGKDKARDSAKDAKLVACEEPAGANGKSKGKGKSKDKAPTKVEAKGKSAGKHAKTAAKDAEVQCRDVKSSKSAKAEKAPAHPSRIWVQIAAGKNKKALAFDWRRFVKENPATFKGREGHTSAWGATNRLLIGPFESESAATAYTAKLKKAGFEGMFIWTSPAGQVVDSLP